MKKMETRGLCFVLLLFISFCYWARYTLGVMVCWFLREGEAE
jgi:hypothetical protein